MRRSSGTATPTSNDSASPPIKGTSALTSARGAVHKKPAERGAVTPKPVPCISPISNPRHPKTPATPLSRGLVQGQARRHTPSVNANKRSSAPADGRSGSALRDEGHASNAG